MLTSCGHIMKRPANACQNQNRSTRPRTDSALAEVAEREPEPCIVGHNCVHIISCGAKAHVYHHRCCKWIRSLTPIPSLMQLQKCIVCCAPHVACTVFCEGHAGNRMRFQYHISNGCSQLKKPINQIQACGWCKALWSHPNVLADAGTGAAGNSDKGEEEIVPDPDAAGSGSLAMR